MDIFKKITRSKLFYCGIGIALGGLLIFGSQLFAQVYMPPAASLTQDDITTNHIKDETILDADISGDAKIHGSKIATGTIPWAQMQSTTTVPLSQGGTATTTWTAGAVIHDGLKFSVVAPSSANNVLTSDGATWVSQAPSKSVTLGGTGKDGALTLTSGATNIDLQNKALLVKNYTSISITGTGQLTLTNPETAGTIIVLKSQGDVTLTSSAAPNIELSSLGSAGGASAGAAGTLPTCYISTSFKTASSTTSVYANPTATTTINYSGIVIGNEANIIKICTGMGGGAGPTGVSGGAAGGAGGRGGGGLYIEVGGALNFSGTIYAKGANGSNGSGENCSAGRTTGGGGGGGAGGDVVIYYNSLTANTGTITNTGGSGGNGGNFVGGTCASAEISIGGGAGGASLFSASGYGPASNGTAGTSPYSALAGGGGGSQAGTNSGGTGGAGGAGGTATSTISTY